jgi:hypothetical protein
MYDGIIEISYTGNIDALALRYTIIFNAKY